MSSEASSGAPANEVTPTVNTISLRRADFKTLSESLDYAAQGITGANFYVRGKLDTVLPYRTLREDALAIAARLASLGLPRGARVAIVGETSPDFLRYFFACQYMGLVPVALPATVNLGGHAAYVQKIRGMLKGCGASVVVASKDFNSFIEEAVEGVDIAFWGTPAEFDKLESSTVELVPTGEDETAYMQFTSGSTGFPKAAMITERALMANMLASIAYGVDMREDDRFVSWLPFYHDMGLIGCLLSPVASQRTVDFLDTREFAMRPRRWLDLMSCNKATFTYGPPFGYELCAHRVREADIDGYDFSHWRVAGVGAEPINPAVLDRFCDTFARANFNPAAFNPSYGMAENTLAISFSPLDEVYQVDWIDHDELTEELKAKPVSPEQGRGFVRCGKPLPGHEAKILDEEDNELDELGVGRILIRGPSMMEGYFQQPEETAKVLADDGWYDTGDIGYLHDGEILVTGRHKDMIIINGRNIWPQDIEAIAERQDEVRSRDASAFGIVGPDGAETAVVVVQSGLKDRDTNDALIQKLRREVYEELGITCLVELVPRHTLPRTSSGKLSRAGTKVGYLERREQEKSASLPEASSHHSAG